MRIWLTVNFVRKSAPYFRIICLLALISSCMTSGAKSRLPWHKSIDDLHFAQLCRISKWLKYTAEKRRLEVNQTRGPVAEANM
jgi:hypothetical protein